MPENVPIGDVSDVMVSDDGIFGISICGISTSHSNSFARDPLSCAVRARYRVGVEGVGIEGIKVPGRDGFPAARYSYMYLILRDW